MEIRNTNMPVWEFTILKKKTFHINREKFPLNISEMHFILQKCIKFI